MTCFVMKMDCRVFGTVLLTGLATLAGAERVSTMPNVVILLADDLGYGELGCQGNAEIPTPHIDAISENGVRFTSGYVTAPNCSPSRAGLLTGRYGTRFGHEFNPIGARNEDPGTGLPLRQRTMVQALQKAGYVTGLVGKWHLGGAADYHPYRRGFDEFFGFTHEGHYFVPEPWDGVTTWLRRVPLPGGGEGRRTFGKVTYSSHMGHDEPDYDANNPIVRGSQPVDEELYLTDALTRESVSFIERHGEKPFCLLVAYNAVHSPLQGADAYMKKFAHIEDLQRRIFAAMLANLDDSVGEISKKLREEGLEKDTMLYFISDNGGPTKELTSSNLPLRGGKGNMYEGGVRVPFMMQWPGMVPKGTTYDRPVITTDLFATTFAAAGKEMPKGPKRDSVNLLPFIKGETQGDPHERIYWRQAARQGLRQGDWKIVKASAKAKWELFDLSGDLSEKVNLAVAKQEVLKELVGEWEKLDGEMVEAEFRQ
ncbi:MAG: sulfatase-like hydrolase/transferase [Akkermansiaceae bacterium]|nr:sulfatase-like hydrolase/transferase [Akkermansiaceae bacterium]MDG1671100.1 sulfatase-like hydrolase/transferase [Akkermansiaceae bacterium]MDG2322500.1 sulfatase-like hydrolase/transferase [Akkermansiaceae bacterium]